jgi:HPt (histidine-containing phosphotransfer) domain-containing protein
MDLKLFAEKLGLEEAEYVELLHLFIEASRSDLERLRSALSEGNPAAAREAVHSLKGAALNMGLNEFYETAEKIMRRIRAGEFAGLEAFLQTLQDLIADLQQIAEGRPERGESRS